MRTLLSIFFLSLLSSLYCNQAIAGPTSSTNPQTTITIDNYTNYTLAYVSFMPTVWDHVPMEQLVSYASPIRTGEWGNIVIEATPTELSGYLLASTFYTTTEYPNCQFRIDSLFNNQGNLHQLTCSAYNCGKMSCFKSAASNSIVIQQSAS